MKLKDTKKILALGSAVAMLGASAVPAMANSTIVNSSASTVEDIDKGGIGDYTTEGKTHTEGVAGNDATQKQESQYGVIDDNADQTSEAKVYATQASTYSVKIPKVIVLNGAAGATNDGKYKVQAKGNIAGNEQITIAPAATFDMSQVGKNDIHATVTQPNTTFGVATTSVEATNVKTVTDQDAFDTNSANADGTVTVTGLTAGSWTGAFDFTISLNAVE